MKLNLGKLHLTSPAFDASGRLASQYTGDKENLAPPLSWSGAPAGTAEFALICHDPDAPLLEGFTHWVLYGIPASVTSLPEGLSADAYVAGVNDAGKPGYFGPLPPQGHGVHHYYFHLYALDAPLKLAPGLTRKQLLDAIADHILVQARLVGLYEN